MNVRTLCLGILSFEEATGYEIKKLSVEGRFSHFIDASFGSIYPALTRLCEEGLVDVRVEQQEGRPSRKVYSITERGREEFVKSLAEPPAPDKIKSEFLFVVLCSEFMHPEQVEKVIDDRIAWIDQELERMNEFRADCNHIGSQFAIGYGSALYQAARDYLKNNKDMAVANARGARAPEAVE